MYLSRLPHSVPPAGAGGQVEGAERAPDEAHELLDLGVGVRASDDQTSELDAESGDQERQGAGRNDASPTPSGAHQSGGDLVDDAEVPLAAERSEERRVGRERERCAWPT